MSLVSTQGIVLRTVKYSETSVIVTIYTKLLGTQGYIVSGVRSSAKNSGKANYFTTAAILDIVVYNNHLKNLNRIKEFKWDYLYQHMYYDIYKNTIATFMVELLQKTLRQPDTNIELYDFIYESLTLLDSVKDDKWIANFPIYFMCQLAHHLGLKIRDNYSSQNTVFDIQEGLFVNQLPMHDAYIEGALAYHIVEFIRIQYPTDAIAQIKLNGTLRLQLINIMENFYKCHISDFSSIYSLPILQQILR